VVRRRNKKTLFLELFINVVVGIITVHVIEKFNETNEDEKKHINIICVLVHV